MCQNRQCQLGLSIMRQAGVLVIPQLAVNYDTDDAHKNTTTMLHEVKKTKQLVKKCSVCLSG